MRIVRFAIAKFNALSDDWRDWSFSRSAYQIQVANYSYHNQSHLLLLAASTKLKYLPKCSRNQVVVPEAERLKLENLIEDTVNTISIANMSARQLSSPNPSIAFYPETLEDRIWLSNKKGILYPDQTTNTSCQPATLDVREHLDTLSDRLDGVALVSEALCHSHACGKFHEYFRVIERAFGLSSKKLIDPLFLYFTGTVYEYTRKEIEKWIVVRHGITHADVKPKLLYESDVSAIIPRLEGAALDVLFNKEKWRSQDVKRTQRWTPPAGMEASGPFLQKGKIGKITLKVMDEFNSFPKDIELPSLPLPDDHWTGLISLDK